MVDNFLFYFKTCLKNNKLIEKSEQIQKAALKRVRQDTDLYRNIRTIQKLKVANKILLPEIVRKTLGFSKDFTISKKEKKEKWKQFLRNAGNLKQLLKKAKKNEDEISRKACDQILNLQEHLILFDNQETGPSPQEDSVKEKEKTSAMKVLGELENSVGLEDTLDNFYKQKTHKVAEQHNQHDFAFQRLKAGKEKGKKDKDEEETLRGII